MNKGTKTVIGVVLFLAIVLVAVGYAAMANQLLYINGTLQAVIDDANFSVVYQNGTAQQPATSGDGTITATITDDIHAVFNVEGLNAKGQTATATYTIENASKDLTAQISAAVTNSNTDYFSVEYEFNGANTATVVAGGTTTITVTATLLKTPVNEEPTALKSTIGVTITAAPVQPGA